MEDILKTIEGEFSQGRYYQQSIDRDIKRAYGKYYTPDFIIDFMLEKTLSHANVLEKPFIKVLDPACGCGFFLIKAYDLLKEKFQFALPMLKEKYKDEIYEIKKDRQLMRITGKEYWRKENLHYHILKHCIYGADIDETALWLCSASLLAKDREGYNDDLNIVYCDSLIPWEKDYNNKQIKEELGEYRLIYGIKNYREDKMEYVPRKKAEQILKRNLFWSSEFDYIIGNPPYVGHKELSMDYKEWLFNNYGEVFRDKSDLSYCFYKRAAEISAEKSITAFISSRYFMESPTGRSLRSYLQNNSKIVQIVDFYGEEIFLGAKVATAIFIISSRFHKDNMVEVWKHEGGKIKNINPKDFEIFTISQSKLMEDRWILISDESRDKLNKIEAKCKNRLGDIVESFQGIITGCDKAFIMDEQKIKALSIEKELLKPWIKNSHVDRYRILESNLKLIYSDMIDEPLKYPNSIMHIEKYRERLENRRECKKGIRPWHQLQWGRKPELFMRDKIVFPYKSKNNRFALDTKGNFCSADVYSFILKEDIEGYTLPFLLGVLNSNIYEFYFKLFAKKMGRGIYDYYPNTVMELRIPDYEACKGIEPLSIELIELYQNSIAKEKIKALEEEIDSILSAYFAI